MKHRLQSLFIAVAMFAWIIVTVGKVVMLWRKLVTVISSCVGQHPGTADNDTPHPSVPLADQEQEFYTPHSTVPHHKPSPNVPRAQ